jgi:hypothetical protein
VHEHRQLLPADRLGTGCRQHPEVDHLLEQRRQRRVGVDSAIAKHGRFLVHWLVRRQQILARESPDAVDVEVERLLRMLLIGPKLAERLGVENGVEEEIDEPVIDQGIALCCHAVRLPAPGGT